MSQGTVIVANGTGATVRASINTAFDALVTSNSGASAPTTMSAYMLWADTTTGYLKIRNAANSAWVIAGRLANVGLGRVLNASLSKSATYTVVAADEGQFLQCSSTFTLSLTAAATLGDGFALVIANTGVGVITVDPAGSETIGGSATLTLAAGDAIVTMCNGSNWIVASDKISTLPVASGGTGVTTSTGTGAVVLGTSPTLASPVLSGTATGTYTLGGTPTLTAPALGTPASGVLTNCTGYVGATESGTWSSSGKAKNTIYQNTSGKKRRVLVSWSGSSIIATVHIDSSSPPGSLGYIGDPHAGSNPYTMISFEVPNNYYYKVGENTGTISITQWHELDE